MKASLLCVCLLVAAQAPPAVAQTAGQPAPMTPIPATTAGAQKLAAIHADTEEMVCHSITSTGTRFVHKECHTPFEWRQMSADAAAYAKYVQERANSFCIGVC